MAERRSRRGLRVGLIVLAILVLAPIAALVLFAARFDPNAYKPQIAEAVKRATGRGSRAQRTDTTETCPASDHRGA